MVKKSRRARSKTPVSSPAVTPVSSTDEIALLVEEIKGLRQDLQRANKPQKKGDTNHKKKEITAKDSFTELMEQHHLHDGGFDDLLAMGASILFFVFLASISDDFNKVITCQKSSKYGCAALATLFIFLLYHAFVAGYLRTLQSFYKLPESANKEYKVITTWGAIFYTLAQLEFITSSEWTNLCGKGGWFEASCECEAAKTAKSGEGLVLVVVMWWLMFFALNFTYSHLKGKMPN